MPELPLDYIVQGVRFEIFEELGCNYFVYPSGATILLVYTPPLLLCTACLAYYIRKLVIASLLLDDHTNRKYQPSSCTHLDIRFAQARAGRISDGKQGIHTRSLFPNSDNGNRHPRQHGCRGRRARNQLQGNDHGSYEVLAWLDSNTLGLESGWVPYQRMESIQPKSLRDPLERVEDADIRVYILHRLRPIKPSQGQIHACSVIRLATIVLLPWLSSKGGTAPTGDSPHTRWIGVHVFWAHRKVSPSLIRMHTIFGL